MKSLNANNVCSNGGDMLAYLYDEMASADRESFEMHLVDCGTCIDDFAELSQSRFPVFEWKRIEFDPLPTPRVVIPFAETTSVSWFDQIRRALSLRPILSFGGLGAAMIVAVVTGYFLFGTTSTGREVARDVEPSATPIRSATAIPPPSVDANPQASSEKEIRAAEPKIIKASTAAKPTVRSQKPKSSQQPKRNDPIPVMSSIDDDEDDSLRLSDIFDEIGASE